MVGGMVGKLYYLLYVIDLYECLSPAFGTKIS